MIRKNIPLFLVMMFLGQIVLAQNPELVNITDLTKIVSTSSHEITPDGKQVIYVKNFIDEKSKEDYAYKSQLWISDLAAPFETKPLTSSEYNISSISLSPDGSKVAFVRPKDGKAQIWILPLKGGESQVVTSEKNGASSPVWAPDGKKILFSSTHPIWQIDGEPTWEVQRPGRQHNDEPNYKAINAGLAKEEISPNPDGSLEELRAYLAKNNSKGDPKVIDRLNFLGERDLSPELSFSHLNILDLETGETEQITNGFQSFFGGSWSPDASYILASSLENNEHPDLTRTTEIWKINLNDKSTEVFFSLDEHSVGAPNFSPDGKWIIFRGQNVEEPSYNMSMLGAIKPDGSGFKWLTESLDRSIGSGKWASNSQDFYFTGANQGGFSLWKVSVSSGKVDPIITGPQGVTSFDVKGQNLVYALTKIENPSEVYHADLANKNAKQITKNNESWLAGKKISKPTAHQLKTEDGFTVDYWVMEPSVRKEGSKYPTVVNMHGGPSAMWGPGEASMWHEFQVMAAKGYGVVYSNPRGSGGYGKVFQKGNFQNWGDGPAADVLGSLDAAMEQYDWIDGDNLVLTGGSYAGYLTAWIVGHDHRFNAAFSQRGVYELTFFMGEGNAWRLVPNHFGYPWEDGVKEIMDYNSPQTYVQNIQTPLLIKHGDQDLRTGVRQSELLYKSLKILGKPVEYVRYPEEGHEMSRSGAVHRRIDRMARIIEFFERYVEHPNN
ncbi:S9 family peptidase [Mongoliibacter ruber]|uniref:Dipeptidyl aminopeptidase/acylaminoacyl peptidase n=1 Tax=Mongoliibacter ruber TaxID=1750599 RepID=A0A2T0WG92_9BACT|nr:S9 family peptidase [Mongoliibacter ruber]PRY85721.1 dipeptidyl aminopeptidase/acylaminoacyl peptidase [Mongoliibacter ruber]